MHTGRTILFCLLLAACMGMCACTPRTQPEGGLGLLLHLQSGPHTQVTSARLDLARGRLRLERQPLYAFYPDAHPQPVRAFTGERGLLALDAGLLLEYPPDARLILSDLPAHALIGQDAVAFGVPEGGLMLYNWRLDSPGVRLTPYLAAAPGGFAVEVGRRVRPLAMSFTEGIWRAAYLLQTQGERLQWAVSLWRMDSGDGRAATRTVLLPDFSPEVMPVPAVWVGDALYLYGKTGLYKIGAGDAQAAALGQHWQAFSVLSPLLGQYHTLPGAGMGVWGGTPVITFKLARQGETRQTAQAALLLGADQVRAAVLHRFDERDLTAYAAGGKRLGSAKLPENCTSVVFPFVGR